MYPVRRSSSGAIVTLKPAANFISDFVKWAFRNTDSMARRDSLDAKSIDIKTNDINTVVKFL